MARSGSRLRGVLLALCTAIACSDNTGPGAELVVTVRTSASTFSPGDSLHIHLEVDNPSDRPDSIATPGPNCPILWRIDGPNGFYAGPNGALAADGSPCTGLSTAPVQLAPGAGIGITYTWTGHRGSLGAAQDPPLGRYWIRAATQPAADISRLIQSPPVAVDLVAAAH